MTDIEDVLKKFIKRDDIDIILINQNVIIILLQLLSCLESMQLLIFIQLKSPNYLPLFFFENRSPLSAKSFDMWMVYAVQ